MAMIDDQNKKEEAIGELENCVKEKLGSIPEECKEKSSC